MQTFQPSLPIDPLLAGIAESLARVPALVLVAAPGAGKTTRVPLALRDASWLGGKCILMQEPRRIAARAAARRMAETLGETVGETVGYRVRLDARITARTRIEVVTDGILLRILQEDPALERYGLVILDEFHERSLDTDLTLALLADTQAGLREDLRIMVMSATLDAVPVAQLLGNAPVVESTGRVFPVDIRYRQQPIKGRVEAYIVETIFRALAEEEGSILAFLPGAAEIHRVARLVGERGLPANVSLHPLYGELSSAEQDLAIQPAAADARKIVLATAIAESSLTIEGIRIVIDGGLMRLPMFDPATGMSRLVTRSVTQDAAGQRCGRAGRTAPGVCYRLWTEAENRALQAQRAPEIVNADLAPLALELSCWGVKAEAVSWLDAPPSAALAQASDLLKRLGALDDEGRSTQHGRAMLKLGLHPRLAHMLLKAKALDLGATGAGLGALLGERDFLRIGSAADRTADLRERLNLLQKGGESVTGSMGVDRGALAQARDLAKSYRKRIGVTDKEAIQPEKAGLLVAFAYPDRIAGRRGGAGDFRLAVGRAACLESYDPLAKEAFLGVADIDGHVERARIFRASPLSHDEIKEHFADLITSTDTIDWSSRDKAVLARRRHLLDRLVLEEKILLNPDPEAVRLAMIQGIRELGLRILPWSQESERLVTRVRFLHAQTPEVWPDWSQSMLLANLEDWLGPYLDNMTRTEHLNRLNLLDILSAQFDWTQRQELERLAPSHILVPSGSHLPIDYAAEGGPTLAVRLQEVFGLMDTPRLYAGQVPLTLVLLSPARRPVQVTQDLKSFWATGYRQVKADLKGRYPKHYWPDNPLQAEATARARPR